MSQHQLSNCAGVNISPTCIAELEAYKVDRATNINKDVPLGALLPLQGATPIKPVCACASAITRLDHYPC